MSLWNSNRELEKPEQVANLFREQAELCLKCIPELERFFNGEAGPSLFKEIVEDEHRGDLLVPKIRELLDNTNALGVFSHEDVLALADVLDNVLDRARRAAAEVDLHDYKIGSQPEAKEFCGIIREQLEILVPLIKMLPGFNKKLISEALVKLNKLETKADQLRFQSIRDLWRNGTDEIEKIPSRTSGKNWAKKVRTMVWAEKAWTKIYEDLEKVTDSCFGAGMILLSMAEKDRA